MADTPDQSLRQELENFQELSETRMRIFATRTIFSLKSQFITPGTFHDSLKCVIQF
jgi:hypothetical protein